VANVSQIIALDKTFLRDKSGKLDEATITHVEDGIKLLLGLR
jgi:mRNA-degrading endonuclease toxin of MazEF toxin-antitoxin module